MKEETYLVFVLVGYDKEDENGKLLQTIELQIIAKNREEAEKKAKKVADKPHYYLQRVVEKYVHTD